MTLWLAVVTSRHLGRRWATPNWPRTQRLRLARRGHTALRNAAPTPSAPCC